MAKMYPPEIRPSTQSNAERRIFRILKQDLSDEWHVLHSLGIAKHPTKPWTEIDFVLIGPHGVYCLEIKGGRVRRVGGVWEFIDRADTVNQKYEGPFEQVGAASAALFTFLKAKHPWIEKSVVGYGVVMPDITFNDEGPDINRAVLYDQRNTIASFAAYIRQISTYWQNYYEPRRRTPIEVLAGRECRSLLETLRGDFDYRPSLAMQLGLIHEELLKLTIEQYRVLNGLESNSRVLITGGAGTGKTMLAIEEVKRLAHDSQDLRILFCCYNRNLAALLRKTIGSLPNVTVVHLHGLMAELIDAAGLKSQLPNAEEDDLFTIFYPESAIEALITMDRFQEYDAVVIDEFQDLLLPAYMEVFEALVKGGLSGGIWRIFYDPHQNIYQSVNLQAWQHIESISSTRYTLSINCRNTKPIAVITSLLSAIDCKTTLHVEGPEVSHEWYRDEAHQVRLISRHVNRLLSDGIQASDIVILSRRRLTRSCLSRGLAGVPFLLTEDALPTAKSSKQIRFATISSFKGLEAEAVFLVDVDNLTDAVALLSVYVGASRAKAYLAVFIAERLHDTYQQLAFDYGQRISLLTSADQQ